MLHASGIPKMIVGFGHCGRPPMVFVTPQRHFVGPTHKYLARSVESPPSVRLRFEVSSFGAHLYSICRKSRGAFGAIAAHIDDILVCGEPV